MCREPFCVSKNTPSWCIRCGFRETGSSFGFGGWLNRDFPIDFLLCCNLASVLVILLK